jgi:UDP-3-O-[3-hydroxymyristoyl] glucosamine N-acyltransferase
MPTSRRFTLREIAEHVGGSVVGEPQVAITGVSPPDRAGPGDLIFVDGEKHLESLGASRAAAAIVAEGVDLPPGMSGIRVRQPALAMARALQILFPRERAFREVSPQAFLGRAVVLGEEVGIGPGAYVGDGVRVGRGTEIHPGATVGRGAVIGEDCILHSGAHVYHGVSIGNRVVIHSGAVIGADGFGFVQEKVEGSVDEPVRHRKMEQVGTVLIEDDVEIGANATIDRAALEATVIARGTKVDNLVMIAHNCRIGRHVILVAQSGIAGSSVLEDYVTIGGQSGVAGHVHLGRGVMVGAKSGVTKDVPAGATLLGSPAFDIRHARRALALVPNLPEYRRALIEVQKRVDRLEAGQKGG